MTQYRTKRDSGANRWYIEYRHKGSILGLGKGNVHFFDDKMKS